MLRVVFITFEAVPGLHVNWGKSFIYLINEVSTIGVSSREIRW